MTSPDAEAKVSAEGRVVIPAPIRQVLRIKPGDTVRFVETPEGEIMITTARALVSAMWANNSGGDRYDAGEAVREVRDQDQQAEDASRERISERFEEPWDEDLETARLMAALGLGT